MKRAGGHEETVGEREGEDEAQEEEEGEDGGRRRRRRVGRRRTWGEMRGMMTNRETTSSSSLAQGPLTAVCLQRLPPFLPEPSSGEFISSSYAPSSIPGS
jgi:hypothetical protein